MAGGSDHFLYLSVVAVAARVRDAAAAAAGTPLIVRVGEEGHGHRMVAVDLPPGRRSRIESLRLRTRLRDELEAAGVALAPHALAPSVDGALRGSVRVGEVEPNWPAAAGNWDSELATVVDADEAREGAPESAHDMTTHGHAAEQFPGRRWVRVTRQR